jgi:hypothetical protein
MADMKRAPQFGPVFDSTGRLMASVARLDAPAQFVIAHDRKGFFNARSGCWVAEEAFASHYDSKRDAFQAATSEFETDCTAFRIAQATGAAS